MIMGRIDRTTLQDDRVDVLDTQVGDEGVAAKNLQGRPRSKSLSRPGVEIHRLSAQIRDVRP